MWLGAIVWIKVDEAKQRQAAFNQTEAKIVQLEEQKRFVEAQKEIGVNYLHSIQLVDYIKSDTPPRIDISAYQIRAPRMWVIDRNQQCVGVVEDGAFKFWKYYKGVCP